MYTILSCNETSTTARRKYFKSHHVPNLNLVHNLKSTFSPKWEQIWRRCDNLTTIAHNGNCAQSHLLLECLLTEVALCLAAHCHVKEGHFSVGALQSGQVGGNKRMAMEVQGGPSTMTVDLHAV